MLAGCVGSWLKAQKCLCLVWYWYWYWYLGHVVGPKLILISNQLYLSGAVSSQSSLRVLYTLSGVSSFLLMLATTGNHLQRLDFLLLICSGCLRKVGSLSEF